jgi:hypothetical protein
VNCDRDRKLVLRDTDEVEIWRKSIFSGETNPLLTIHATARRIKPIIVQLRAVFAQPVSAMQFLN